MFYRSTKKGRGPADTIKCKAERCCRVVKYHKVTKGHGQNTNTTSQSGGSSPRIGGRQDGSQAAASAFSLPSSAACAFACGSQTLSGRMAYSIIELPPVLVIFFVFLFTCLAFQISVDAEAMAPKSLDVATLTTPPSVSRDAEEEPLVSGVSRGFVSTPGNGALVKALSLFWHAVLGRAAAFQIEAVSSPEMCQIEHVKDVADWSLTIVVVAVLLVMMAGWVLAACLFTKLIHTQRGPVRETVLNPTMLATTEITSDDFYQLPGGKLHVTHLCPHLRGRTSIKQVSVCKDCTRGSSSSSGPSRA